MLSLPKLVFKLVAGVGSLEAVCPRCRERSTHRAVHPESGASLAAAQERLWQCQACEGISIAPPPLRRAVLVLVLGGFGAFLLAGMAVGIWLSAAPLFTEAPAGFAILGLVLAAPSAFGLHRIGRTLRRLTRRHALIPAHYDPTRALWILEGTL